MPRPEPSSRFSDAERLAALRLARSENVGPITYRELIDHFGSASTALEGLPDLSHRGGLRRSIRIGSTDEAQREFDACTRLGINMHVIGEPAYPSRLAAIDAAPPVLFTHGHHDLLSKLIVSIVGSRQCSAAGIKMAALLASGVAQAGYVIASGLARGIDKAAHDASLASGTIAVLAGGLDNIYPPEHASLQRTIAETGCLVTEQSLGFQPRARDFPKRNRIISGLAIGVIIVEATDRSGSLVTARNAAEQGREVFAVPGHPLDPRASGTNALIKQGAPLVTEAADVISALSLITGLQERAQSTPFKVTAEHKQPAQPQVASCKSSPLVDAETIESVYRALSFAPVDVDALSRATGLTASTVRIIILELELAGRINRPGYNLIARAPESLR